MSVLAFRVSPIDGIETTPSSLAKDRVGRTSPAWFRVDGRPPFQASIPVQHAFAHVDAKVKDRVKPNQRVHPGRLKPIIGVPEHVILLVLQPIDQQIAVEREPCGDRLHAIILQTQGNIELGKEVAQGVDAPASIPIEIRSVLVIRFLQRLDNCVPEGRDEGG